MTHGGPPIWFERGEFNNDAACGERSDSDGSMQAIDCDAVEDEYAKTIRQHSARDYLVYNAPLEDTELVLRGEGEGDLSGLSMDNCDSKLA